MLEIVATEKHAEELRKITEEIVVSYSLGFDQDGSPTVGIRRCNKDGRNEDCIVCDNVVYLVAGDAVDKNGRAIESVTDLHNMPVEDICINIQAQAMITEHLVTVSLGTRRVGMREIVSNEKGILRLNKEK